MGGPVHLQYHIGYNVRFRKDGVLSTDFRQRQGTGILYFLRKLAIGDFSLGRWFFGKKTAPYRVLPQSQLGSAARQQVTRPLAVQLLRHGSKLFPPLPQSHRALWKVHEESLIWPIRRPRSLAPGL